MSCLQQLVLDSACIAVAGAVSHFVVIRPDLYQIALLSCVLDAIEEGELTENRIVFSRLTCCDLCCLSRTKRSSDTNLPFNVRSLLEIYWRSGRKALGDIYITPQIST